MKLKVKTLNKLGAELKDSGFIAYLTNFEVRSLLMSAETIETDEGFAKWLNRVFEGSSVQDCVYDKVIAKWHIQPGGPMLLIHPEIPGAIFLQPKPVKVAVENDEDELPEAPTLLSQWLMHDFA